MSRTPRQSKQVARRSVAKTVLLVGEGYAEVAFLSHLKSIYVQRGHGLQVTIKNARGKGAMHVVNFTIRQLRQTPYDVSAALLDTDVDWNQDTEKLARKNCVQVVKSDPCLECLLLQIHGHKVHNRTPAQLKKAFFDAFGAEAFEESVYKQQFQAHHIHNAKDKLPALGQLLALLGVAN